MHLSYLEEEKEEEEENEEGGYVYTVVIQVGIIMVEIKVELFWT